MKNEKQKMVKCQICGRQKGLVEVVFAELLRPAIVETIRKNNPDWASDGYICIHDLNLFRSEYIKDVLAADKGELSSLDMEVVESLREQELLARNINEDFSGQLTLGERAADKVAKFGGSWRFIIIFFSILIAWIGVNSFVLLKRPFDPYPFILLNLVLSCLAAMQAPVIMMSQNRQEEKDRLRSENDYQINLKAELEIRHLVEKMDHLLSRQWQRLIEIQQIQIDLLKEVTVKDRKNT